MKKTVSKDTPLAELTLRKYEKPFELSDRDLVKKKDWRLYSSDYTIYQVQGKCCTVSSSDDNLS